MNIQSWFPLELTGSISLLSKGLSRVFSNTTIGKHQSFGTQPYLWSNSHIRIQLLEKPQLWLYGPLLIKWSLCFLICCLGWSSFSSKEQVSFNFIVAVTICSDFGAQENKVCHCFHIFPPSIGHEVIGLDAMIFVFWKLSFKPAFSLPSFTFIKSLFSSPLLSSIRLVSSVCLRLLILLPAILIPACASPSPFAWYTLHIS